MLWRFWSQRAFLAAAAVLSLITIALLLIALFYPGPSREAENFPPPAVPDSPAAFVPESAPPAAAIEAPSRSLADSVGRLIDAGRFAAASEKMKKLDSGEMSAAQNRINKLVISKADSLLKEIRSLANQGKFGEAFGLEQRFDKDVFQLVGQSQALRQKLLTRWVLSYRKSYNATGAIEKVSREIRGILGDSNYRVEFDSNGSPCLVYGSRKRN